MANIRTDDLTLTLGGVPVKGQLKTDLDTAKSEWRPYTIGKVTTFSSIVSEKDANGKWNWKSEGNFFEDLRNSNQSLKAQYSTADSVSNEFFRSTAQGSPTSTLNSGRTNQFNVHGAPLTAQRLGVPGSVNKANPDDPNGAPNGGGDDQTSPTLSKEQVEDIKKAFESNLVSGTRTGYYGDVKYPENLDTQIQDCIKFSILKYNPRTLSLELNQQRRKLINKNILGTIVLPIPAGISDRNSADWQSDSLDVLTQGVADAINQFVIGGGNAAANSVKSSVESIAPKGNTKLLEALIASKTVESVTNSNILSREYGGIVNPNLELLFNGPSLRSFTFNFRLTPREKKESENIRKIIRFFKQAMAPKRSESVLLLKSPHTFGIQYLSSNEEHPYLNKFKECALTDCSVSYTPDGSYMTYTDSSMTAYELSLTFQELEAVFDDDYGNEKEIKSIGY